jgi:hypothetical protein
VPGGATPASNGGPSGAPAASNQRPALAPGAQGVTPDQRTRTRPAASAPIARAAEERSTAASSSRREDSTVQNARSAPPASKRAAQIPCSPCVSPGPEETTSAPPAPSGATAYGPW